MKLLKELFENELLPGERGNSKQSYHIRHASRTVIIDQDNKTPLIHTKNWFKIPGGGIDSGENIEEAAIREAQEESGCQIEIIDDLGLIIEYRDSWKQVQLSFCFLAKVLGDKGETEFTQNEKEQGFVLKWHDLDEAISLLESVKNPNQQMHANASERELTFMKVAKKLIEEKKR